MKAFYKEANFHWFLVYLFLGVVVSTILIIFLQFRSYYGDINFYVSAALDFNVNLVLILFIFFALPLIYSIALIIQYIRNLKHKTFFHISRIHKFLPLILLVFFSLGGLILLFLINSYSKHLFIMFQFYSIFIYPLLIFVPLIFFTILVKKYGNRLLRIYNKWIAKNSPQKLNLGIFFGIYLFSWFYPLIFMPANVIPYSLPEKPKIIAHRGGSAMGPENTIEVVETSLNYDIVGWEVDISISKDGIPFLMHDDTLKRTTNVEEIFSSRQNDAPSSFTWAELQKLNAGAWFVERDPYGTIASGKVTPKQVEAYKHAKIPSFEQVLNFTREHNIRLDYDDKNPPEDHPYAGNFTEILFNMTVNLMDDLSNIMIPTSSERWLNLIDAYNVTEIWTGRDYINTGDGYSNSQYRQFYEDEFPVMVYTINSYERFSQLWCLGVQWVKTDTPYKFSDVYTPIWFMDLPLYYFLWGCLYLISISLLGYSIKKLNTSENIK